MTDVVPKSGTHEQILADLPAAVVVVDQDGRMLYRNDGAASLLGPELMVGRELGLPVTRDDGYLELATVPPRILEIRVSDTTFDGQPAQLLVMHDVTSLASSQRRLQESVEGFELALGVAAHELRNPLAVLLATLDTLVDRPGAIDAVDLPALLGRMRWHAMRMRVLVDNTLAVASGPRHLQTVPEPVDVARVVQVHVRHASDASQFRVTGDADAQALVTKRHLDQILLNLISNAEKYGEPPFEIDVGVRAGAVRITVRDHGPGVPDDFRDQLFSRYARANVDGTRAGTGLGLWVSREMARRNGGELRYTGDDDGGTFVLTIPTADVATG